MTKGFYGFLLLLGGSWGCGEDADCMAGPGFRCVLFVCRLEKKSKYLTQ